MITLKINGNTIRIFDVTSCNLSNHKSCSTRISGGTTPYKIELKFFASKILNCYEKEIVGRIFEEFSRDFDKNFNIMQRLNEAEDIIVELQELITTRLLDVHTLGTNINIEELAKSQNYLNKYKEQN